MVFEIQGKVALVTGGASGIGLQYSKELLRNGAKGIVLADINPEFGAKALKEIQEEFGPDKAIFVVADATNIEQFENAFKATINKYKHVDILFNNAGILNDAVWEKEIAINVNATVNGVILAMEKKYLTQYKQGDDALIVNISSIAGLAPFAFIPIYTATKHAVLGLTKSWGQPEHYETTKIRVIAFCPGVTLTPLILDMSGRNFGDRYEQMLQSGLEDCPTQEPNFLAKEAMRVVKYAPNGTAWVIEGGEPAYQFVFPDRNTMKKNVLKC